MTERDLDAVRADDALIDRLAAGEAGGDEVTRLLADLRDEAREPAPVPEVVVAPSRPHHHWAAGLLGAAAATVLIAGSGVVLHATGVFSPLEDRAELVRLAGTLDEMEQASTSGDEDTARRLLSEARKLVNGMKDRDARAAAETSTQSEEPVTTTVVSPAPQPRPHGESEVAASEPETVTEVSTVTVTDTVQVPVAPTPETSETTEPTEPTTTIKLLPDDPDEE